MGSSVRMRTFLLVTAAVFAQNLVQAVEEDSPRYSCPMLDIDFHGHDLDLFRGIGSWQECGHICLIAPDCKFWTWHSADGVCFIKSSDAGMVTIAGCISGERECNR